jgi:hypothetical protein
MTLMDSKFMGNKGARNTLIRVIESIHFTVPLPTTGRAVPSAV